jgi:hypothetical protein
MAAGIGRAVITWKDPSGHGLCIDLSGILGTTRQARDLLGRPCRLTGVALTGPTQVERIIADFTLRSVGCDSAFFFSRAEADAWLTEEARLR